MVNSKAGPGNGKLYTEDDWNTESSVADEPYRYSKVRRVLLCSLHLRQGVTALLCAHVAHARSYMGQIRQECA